MFFYNLSFRASVFGNTPGKPCGWRFFSEITAQQGVPADKPQPEVNF